MRRNVSGQFIGCQLVSKTDGSAVTSGTTTVFVTGDAGTQATGSVGSGAATHEGNGYWTYAPAQAETNYTQVAYTFVNTSAINSTVQVFTTAYDASGRVDVGAIGGTTQTARDIGASVLISSGTGAGQLSINSGVVSANVTQYNGLSSPSSAGRPEVNTTHWSGTLNTPTDFAGCPKVTVKSGTGTGEISITSGVVSSNMTQIDGSLTNGNNATLNLKQLNIVNSNGHALVARATSTSNGSPDCGIYAEGAPGAASTSSSAMYLNNSGASTSGKGLTVSGSGGSGGVSIRMTGQTGWSNGGTTLGDVGDVPPVELLSLSIDAIEARTVIIDEFLSGTTTTPTTVTVTAVSVFGDDAINGMVLLHLTNGIELIQTRRISDFVRSTSTITVDTPWTTTPVDGDKIKVLYSGTAISSGRINLRKNISFSNFEFKMYDSTNHLPATGLTVTAQRSIDGGAYASCTNSPAEVGSGTYKIDLSAADLNGNCISFKFSSAGADQQDVTVVTQE